MTTNETKPFRERRARTRKEIKQLIEERNRVLAQYYELVSHTDDIDSPDRYHETIADLLQDFCQELVDYLATGHFEIYRRIEDGGERRKEMLKLAEKVYDSITLTTQIAVDFNDRYDLKSEYEDESFSELPTHLSDLGQSLATRIDLEDQFINSILAHADKPILRAV